VLESADKKYSIRIGGRIHVDTNFVDPDPGIEGPAPGIGDDFDDATFLRRLRMYLRGDITKHVDFKFEIDFFNPSSPSLRDAYVTVKNLKECWGCWMPSIRIGHHYEPIGLDTVSSDNHLAFIERAGMLALHPERSIGLSLLDSFWNDHAYAQVGVFSTDNNDEDDGFAIWDSEDTDGGVAFTGRFALIPWAKDTCHFVHLGASASLRETSEVRYRARPGLGRGPRVVDTLALTNIEGVALWNAEAGLVWGPLHAAAEYTSVSVDDPARGDPTFTAWYAQVGYFLTGESKAYDFKSMLWGNLKPCCSFLSGTGLDKQCCCLGAFELVARYDVLDLSDGAVLGGEITAWTAGLNWYLSPHTRLMFDVTNQTIENRNTGGVIINDADLLAFLMRVDIHF
jgi:phosphate-selective porin OprO and OprP